MKTKVLLVVDDAETRRPYTEILTSAGYEVTLTSSGEEALGTINGYHPDVILMDAVLPGKNGIEIARELSQRSDTRDIPVVLVTALSTLPGMDDDDPPPGVRRLIYKPCRPRTLVEGVEDTVRFREVRSAAVRQGRQV